MEYLVSLLSKSATSTAQDISEWGLLFFGLVLTIGALGEYKMLPRLAFRASHKVFEFMVAIGIAGELIADGGVFLFSRHLQTINDRELAGLNKEAADARRDAALANERATKIIRDAAIEQQARIAMWDLLKPRRILGERRRRLKKILDPFKGQRVWVTAFRVNVSFWVPPSEILNFLQDFVETLNDAGIITDKGIETFQTNTDTPFALHFRVCGKSKKLVDALIQGLKDERVISPYDSLRVERVPPKRFVINGQWTTLTDFAEVQIGPKLFL